MLCRLAHGAVNFRLKLEGDGGPEPGEDCAIDRAASRCFSVDPTLTVGAMEIQVSSGEELDKIWCTGTLCGSGGLFPIWEPCKSVCPVPPQPSLNALKFRD